jgi:outer membrane protein assembly factor BamE
MHKLLALSLTMMTLTSCSYFQIHKSDVQQGNVLTQENAQALHLGMSESAVRDVLGSPLLTNVFNDKHIDYVYTYRPGYGNPSEKYMTLVFKNARLDEIKGNLYSAFIKN